MKWLLPTYLLHLSIRRKLMLLIMFTCGLILLATTIVFVVKETGSLIHEQRRNLSSLADILGKNISASLTFNDPKSALDSMNSLSVKSDILAAYILRPDTTIFARYLASGIQTDKLPFEQLGLTPSVDSSRSVLEKLKTDSNHFLQLNDQVTLVTPIRLDNQEIGTVVLFADMRELRSRLLDTLLISSLILALATIAAYLLSMRLQGLISDPILQLSDAMHKVSKTKEFSLRVVKAGNDEIGRLYDGFNEMLQEIEERDLVLCQRQEHLENLAHFDPLTRLPNRMLFHDRLQQAMCLALRADQVIALMFLDLDRFKDINDTLGHRIGDLLLRQVADRMSLVLRDCDTIARLGGDEFTIFTQNIIDAENASQVAHKLLNIFKIPYTT
ncbi:MAG: diguanylate cyclase, partial [Trichlorobacter sp.]|uniref:sensor domain-containing diguanylate cyclase n=1 Tax=Trichlorobacter sp. TaxID=2911007 RepID=UPI00256DA25B